MAEQLKVEYISVDKITPYAGNAKLHPEEQIEQIKKSIQEFGFNDPLALWHGEVVEGHGRLIAAKELGMKEVPVIRLDELTDEQRRAYALVHNKLTMNSGFDFGTLEIELGNLELDMEQFGFGNSLEEVFDESDLDDNSTKNNVVVSINCGSYDNYETIKERLQNLADEIDGSLAVKMA